VRDGPPLGGVGALTLRHIRTPLPQPLLGMAACVVGGKPSALCRAWPKVSFVCTKDFQQNFMENSSCNRLHSHGGGGRRLGMAGPFG
jgi:hypothetical protein